MIGGILPSAALVLLTAAAPYTVVRGSTAAVGLDEEVGDVLVVGGKLELSGVVRGFVYGVDSDITIGPTAVLQKPLTLHEGVLRVSEGAVLPRSIELAGAELIAPGERLTKSGGKESLGPATIERRDETIDAAKLSMMKLVLPFDRFSPMAEEGIEAVKDWHPGLGLALEKSVDTPKELMVGGVVKLSFAPDKIKGAVQRGYRGARGGLLLTAVRLTDEATARAFWQVIAGIPETKVGSSIRCGLGDGGHWFFESRGRATMLWQRGPWFIAVETRLGTEGTTFVQEAQFNEQVLGALRSALAKTSGAR